MVIFLHTCKLTRDPLSQGMFVEYYSVIAMYTCTCTCWFLSSSKTEFYDYSSTAVGMATLEGSQAIPENEVLSCVCTQKNWSAVVFC